MKQILMASAAALTLFSGAALAQMGGAADQEQNRQMQAAPDKDTQDTHASSQGGMRQDDQSRPAGEQQNDQRPPMSDRREGQGETGREHQAAAHIAPTKVLNGSEKVRIQREVIESSAAPRVDNLNFTIRVGVAIPRTVRVVPVPPEIVAINPGWNGFLYFVSGDEVVVVDPNSYSVVGVLEA